MSKNTSIADLINYISVDGSGNVVLSTGQLVATQNYVTTAVSNLVASAPSTLDTLNELAAALGNDANFATTVATSIGTKLNLSGGTLTGALSGTSATFSGSLQAATGSNFVGTSVNTRILVTASGVANSVLGFNNSGSTTTGVTNNTAYLGVLQAYPLVFITDSVERLRIDSTGAATFSSSVTATGLSLTTSGSTNATITSTGTNVYSYLSFFNTTTAYGYDIGFGGSASIAPNSFYVYGGSSASVKLAITSSGNVGIGTTTPTGTYGKLSVAGGISILNDNNAKLEIGRYSSGAPNSYIKIGTNSNSLRITNAADSVDLITFANDGNVGIGTSSINAVASGARVLQVDGSAYGFILASSGSVTGQFAGNIGGIVTIGSRSNHDVTFTTNDAERMRLTTTGPGTIGCLLVNKTTASSSYSIQTQSANGAYMASASGPGDANYYSTSPTIGYHFYGDQGGASKFNVTGAGKGYFAAGVQFGSGSGTLNYYEEGNWTPQLAWNSGTYVMGGLNSGRYVRVGNLVHLQFQLQWSSISGSPGGTLRVNGVPFAAGGTSRSAGTICANNSIILSSGYTWLGLTIDPGASFIYIIENAQSGGYNHGPSVNSSGVVYSLTITYSII
jgi:hypothetical protein